MKPRYLKEWLNLTSPLNDKDTRAVDPHSFYADPDPAVFLNADPDPESKMNADPCGSGSSLINKFCKK